MNETIGKALRQWGVDGAEFELVAARENAVYAVSLGNKKYALRLHRQGYRSDAELCSELDWMAKVAHAGISVPAPIPAKEGELLHHIDGIQVDVLTWLNGQTMADVFPALSREDRRLFFFDLGKEMAQLHQVSDSWDKPDGFERVEWNHDGLLGEAPLWDRFWGNPGLTSADRKLAEEFRQNASTELGQIGPSLDYGLIHADLVPDNVLIDGATLRLIDFDDGGFGYRLFEIATVLLKQVSEPDYPALRDSLIEGYRSLRPLDTTHLDLFLALRAATYVGWNIARMSEPNGIERNARFVAKLKDLATRYLAHHHRG